MALCIFLPDQLLTCRNIPAWKRLIHRPLSTDNRISLIKVIFSNPHEAEEVKGLCGDYAQAFVDVVDQVLYRPLTSEELLR